MYSRKKEKPETKRIEKHTPTKQNTNIYIAHAKKKKGKNVITDNILSK
jgi:hypothetical protein